MSRDRKMRILILVLIGLAVSSIMIFSILPESPTNTLSTPLSVIIRPIEKLVIGVRDGIGQFVFSVQKNTELTVDNQRLKEENLALRLKIKDNEQAAEAYASLKQAFSLKDRFPERRFVAANVLQRPFDLGFDYYRLDVGTKDGIDFDSQMGFPVVDDNANVVGMIVRSDGISSKMIAIYQTGFSCNVFSEKDPLNTLNLHGNSSDDEDVIALATEIPKEANIAVGDKVFTSGRGGIFPEGFMCGTIASISEPDFLGKRQAEINLSSPIDEIDVFFVLLPNINEVEVSEITESDE